MKQVWEIIKIIFWFVLLMCLVLFLSQIILFYLLNTDLENFAKDHKNTFQALASFGIFTIPLAWWKWKNKERETLTRNLSSISVKVFPDSVAEIKNTSNIEGSELLVRLYKPHNFGERGKNHKFYKNHEFLKYAAVDKKDYFQHRKLLSDSKSIEWNKSPFLTANLSIGEIAQFHLKDIQDDEKPFIHFAPIRIVTRSRKLFAEIEPKEKYMLFQFTDKTVRDVSIDDSFLRDQLHPYGKWILVCSK